MISKVQSSCIRPPPYFGINFLASKGGLIRGILRYTNWSREWAMELRLYRGRNFWCHVPNETMSKFYQCTRYIPLLLMFNFRTDICVWLRYTRQIQRNWFAQAADGCLKHCCPLVLWWTALSRLRSELVCTTRLASVIVFAFGTCHAKAVSPLGVDCDWSCRPKPTFLSATELFQVDWK